MNNSQNLPHNDTPLEETIVKTPLKTTVFSDGSTFDYENGYQNNGAPVATRDRVETPKIVKSHGMFTALGVVYSIFGLIFLAIIAGGILGGVGLYQSAENGNSLIAGINKSGQVEFVQGAGVGSILVKRPDGNVFKCDLSMASNNGNPTGFVFCGSGGPATFSIPLPHDPSNVFYVAPDKDNKK